MLPTTKAVIMAGGLGERFWPASTRVKPKQFIDLSGGGTLIQQTVLRLAQFIPFRDIFVVTSEAYVDLARAQLPHLPGSNFIIEPVGRDTAPCIGLAAVWLEKMDPDAVMLVVPSDHYIPDSARFCELAQGAVSFAASSEYLVTLGIRPDRPETAYGYIELGEACYDLGVMKVHRAKRFVEKPDRKRAEAYLASGNYLWNAGMFAWTIKTVRHEIALHCPELHDGLQKLSNIPIHEEFMQATKRLFPTFPKTSIDYGLMERSDKVCVVPSDFHWDDLGSWTAMARLRSVDTQGNTTNGLVVAEDCHNMIIESKGRLIATLGVHDLIVVETEDAVLVCARDRAQDIRNLIPTINKALE